MNQLLSYLYILYVGHCQCYDGFKEIIPLVWKLTDHLVDLQWLYLVVTSDVTSYYLDITQVTQDPENNTFCKGSNAVLSCVIFDNTTANVADTTSWFTNNNPPVRFPDSMINNTRDGDVVTSVLTIESVSLDDNGNGYLCTPSLDVRSSVGVISIAGGEYTLLRSAKI